MQNEQKRKKSWSAEACPEANAEGPTGCDENIQEQNQEAKKQNARIF